MNEVDRKRLAAYRLLCKPCKKFIIEDEEEEPDPSGIDGEDRNDPFDLGTPGPKPTATPTPGIDGEDRNDPFDLGTPGPKPTATPPIPPIPAPIPEPIPKKLIDEFPMDQDIPGPTFLGTPNPIPDVDIPPNIVDPPIDDPPPIDPPPPPPPPVPPSVCPSMHPTHTSVPGGKSQAQQVNDITAYVNNKGFRHDPDGIPWIPRSSWVAWDGITTINPCTSTTAQIKAFVFPPPGGVHTMRGLRERFYEVNPFKDNQNPTVAEIEDWNIEIIRHFRRLLGFNQTTHPVYNHKCTYLRAAWSEERARSNHWTATYPGTLDSAAGPCTIPFSSNAHCGGGFILTPADQAPYLCPANMAACTAQGGAEGIQSINTDIPWSIKIGRIIGTFLNSDGIGAHTGPFIGREYFGSAWYMTGGSTVFRGKWTGTLNSTC
jgi:hypothetical protein